MAHPQPASSKITQGVPQALRGDLEVRVETFFIPQPPAPAVIAMSARHAKTQFIFSRAS